MWNETDAGLAVRHTGRMFKSASCMGRCLIRHGKRRLRVLHRAFEHVVSTFLNPLDRWRHLDARGKTNTLRAPSIGMPDRHPAAPDRDIPRHDDGHLVPIRPGAPTPDEPCPVCRVQNQTGLPRVTYRPLVDKHDRHPDTASRAPRRKGLCQIGDDGNAEALLVGFIGRHDGEENDKSSLDPVRSNARS